MALFRLILNLLNSPNIFSKGSNVFGWIAIHSSVGLEGLSSNIDIICPTLLPNLKDFSFILSPTHKSLLLFLIVIL